MTIFSKPKVIIPIVFVIAIALGAYLYRHVGVAPVVTLSPDTTSSPTVRSGETIDLSFPKSGRVESVDVASGQTVHKGQVLARLSAPDAEGVVSQAKGALDLARAQFASLNTQYATAKKQQDTLVENAYKTMLSSNLEGVPSTQDLNTPIITGAYTCGTQGEYILKPFASGDGDSKFSLNFTGLEKGTIGVKYDNPVSLGTCGLQIKFNHVADFNPFVTWTINIPNTKGASYTANNNAYQLAVSTREKTLGDLAATIGQGSNDSVAMAQVHAAEGAYQAALGAYQSNVITAPVDGVVTFVDKDLTIAHAISSNTTVISIIAQ